MDPRVEPTTVRPLNMTNVLSNAKASVSILPTPVGANLNLLSVSTTVEPSQTERDNQG